VNDAQGLAELLHAAEVAVIAVAIDTDWDVELYLVISIIWLGFAYIPWDTRTTEHDTSEGEVEGISSRDDSDSLCTTNPDSVVCQKFLRFINTVTKLRCPLVDVIEQTEGNILVDSSWPDICGVETGSGNSFIEFLMYISAAHSWR
jgi:hypothetical protein